MGYDIFVSVIGGVIAALAIESLKAIINYFVHKKNDRPESGKLDGHSS